ncbi:glycine N-acyltransferase-like [Eleutherodactylus coqui]|uniref:glycine N-acyltransferase-like n=1 Tax=Eleutherodactylus coqui TaxID=57060 RepID=UPI003461ADB5
MLVLTCSSKLATLRRLLTHNYPESLKVCGALHQVIDKNPFRLQVLVDQWPDFTSVMCRPPLEEMTDPLDRYTNTYFLFSKDPQGLRQFLQDPQTVNWRQELQIQGCQPTLTGVLQEVSSKHGSQMHTTSNLLYMRDGMEDEEMEKLSKLSSDDLQYTPLQTHEAHYVNDQWLLGKNEHSLHFVERCIQTLPSISARKTGVDQPVAWAVIDHSVEIRMGYTSPAFRNMGMNYTLLRKMAAVNHQRGFPIYAHTAPDNKASQAVLYKAKFQQRGTWVQWRFQQKSLNAKY